MLCARIMSPKELRAFQKGYEISSEKTKEKRIWDELNKGSKGSYCFMAFPNKAAALLNSVAMYRWEHHNDKLLVFFETKGKRELYNGYYYGIRYSGYGYYEPYGQDVSIEFNVKSYSKKDFHIKSINKIERMNANLFECFYLTLKREGVINYSSSDKFRSNAFKFMEDKYWH